MTVPMEYKTASRDFEALLVNARDAMSLATTNMSYTAVQAVLTVFRRRLAPSEVAAFAQVLPPVLRALFVTEWDPEEAPVAFASREAMTREVQTYRGDHNFAPDTAIAEVAGVLRKHVDNRELDAVLARLPAGARDYWQVEEA